jgi:MinD-like ATPase involved in chromosome partitioning or flagellar assembly
MRKAAEKALRKVMKSLKEEPSTVVVTGSDTGTSENVIRDITSWLFKEEDNGNSNS